MREIYTAPTVAAAEARFAEFAEQWRERYPAMIDTWRRAWAEFVPFLDFPIELRTIVQTTDESVNRLPLGVVAVASRRRGGCRRFRRARGPLVPGGAPL